MKLYLHVPRVGFQGVVDHHAITVKLQRNHKHQQQVGENHCTNGEPGAAFMSPQITMRIILATVRPEFF